jgi:hypothetical protein
VAGVPLSLIALAILQQLTWKDKLRFDLWARNPRSPYTYKGILFEEIDFPVWALWAFQGTKGVGAYASDIQSDKE